jgi:hypothetical protein
VLALHVFDVLQGERVELNDSCLGPECGWHDGSRLVLALDTVKGHNRRIYEKLQVQRRTEAVARARELGAEIVAAADEIERTRRIPEALLERLHASRLFRMLLPRSAGGDETEPAVYVAAVEELAARVAQRSDLCEQQQQAILQREESLATSEALLARGLVELARHRCSEDQFRGHVAFIGEIDASLNQRRRLDNLRTPVTNSVSEHTFQVTQCLAALPVRFGTNQIIKTLGFGEIQLAILERAAGKLPGLGGAYILESRERREQRRQHSTASMDVKFRDILSGRARGSREPKDHRIVDR